MLLGIMKTFLTILLLFFSFKIYANPIILDCTCLKSYFYDTSNTKDCDLDRVLKIDLKKNIVNYLDSDGIDEIKRLKELGAVIELNQINSSEIKYYFSFFNTNQIDRFFTLNRYTGQLNESVYFNDILKIDYESICVKTKALF